MPLAVSMYSYHGAIREGRLDRAGFIREAAALGVDGVELLDFYSTGEPARDRAVMLDHLASTDLTVPIFSVSNDFAKASQSDRDEQVRKIEFGIGEAVAYGAGVVRVFAGDVKDGIGAAEAFNWIVDGLSVASDLAKERGVRLALENHGKLAGRGQQVREMIDAVRQQCGHDTLGANPDTGNFLLVDERPQDAIAQVADVAAMVHFKDFVSAPDTYTGWTFTSLMGRRFIGSTIGEGDVDLAACIAALRGAGFKGWFSLEYEGVDDPLTAVPKSVANARRLLG